MKENPKPTPTPYPVRDVRQRKELTSPIRLEVLGLFTGPEPLSVSEIAARMGRPATAVYYHVHRLQSVGLLVPTGSRRSGKRRETLFRPVAECFDLTPAPGSEEQAAGAVATLNAAQGMAVRDMKAALATDTARFDGETRNFVASRMHARLSPETLAEVNRHLDALLELFQREPAVDRNANGEFCSLTFALMPLRGRQRNE